MNPTSIATKNPMPYKVNGRVSIVASFVSSNVPHTDMLTISCPAKKPTLLMGVNLSILVEMAFKGLPITLNPKYDPEISVAAPAPIRDIFIGVSVHFSIRKNATNNSMTIEMMYFFIWK